MKRELKSLFAVASLVLAAAFTFIACGEGEILDALRLELLEQDSINPSERTLWDKITDKDPVLFPDGTNWSSEEPPEPSSSSKEEDKPSSSSASNPSDPSSSSKPSGGTSSSATGGEQSSSSVKKSSSSSAPVVSPGGCSESNKKSDFKCEWNIKSNLTPGKTLKPLATAGQTGCDIRWKYKDHPLSTDCYETNADGFEAVGNSMYILFAELDCSGTKHTNACDPTAGVKSAEAPYLTGDCKWSKTPTTTARGAVPSGVTLVDNGNVCTGDKTIVYKYDDLNKTWPKEGGPLPEAKTYSDVQATVKCSNDFSPDPAQPCPALPVKAGADHQITCSGDQISATTCNKIEQKVLNDECIDFEIDWKNANYHPTITISCEGQFTGNNPTSSVSVKVGTKPSVSKSGDYYVAVKADLASSLQVGPTEVLGICVSYTTTGTAPATGVTCKLGN